MPAKFVWTQEQKLSVIGIMLSIFLAALDQTIVATALPRIVTDLNGTNLYAWVATAYLLASTVALPIFGRLSEILSRKWVLLVADLIFLVGSALSGAAHTMDQLIAFRALQGIGSGGLFAVALTVLGLLFPPRQRGRIQGLFGAVFGIANVLGPWLGGVLTDQLSWRWIFYVNMPFGALAIFFIIGYMPLMRPEGRHRFDYLGAIFLALMTVPLLLALSWGGSTYPWGSTRILGLFALAAIGIVAFIVSELRTKEPMFVLSLFRDTTFRWAMMATLFFGAAFLGAILFLPLYLVQVQGISATDSGLSLTPLTLGVVVGSFVSGQLATRHGRYKNLIIVGMLWLSAMLLVAHFVITQGAPLWQIWVAMVLVGLGMGPGMPIYTLAVQNTVPRERMGVASSAAQFFRQIGSSIGAALMGTVLISAMQADVPKFLPAQVRASQSSFTSSGSQSTTDIAPAVRGDFSKIENEITAALAGEQKAYAEVMRNPQVPTAYRKEIPKGGIPQGIAAEFAASENAIPLALAGNPAAKQMLLKNPEIPAQLRQAIVHPPASPAAQAAIAQKAVAGARAAEPGVAKQALAAAQKAVRQKLSALSGTVISDLKRGLDYGITHAVRSIYLYSAIMAFIALLATFLMPDRELHSGEGYAPAVAVAKD